MFKQRFRITVSIAIASVLASLSLHAADLIVAQDASPTPETKKKAKLVDLWQPGDSGQRMNIRGRVTSLDGSPLAGIFISIRQANGDGEYTERYRTTLVSDAKGRYQFGSVVPNNDFGARHVHVTVYQDGWEYFDMSILFEGDPNLDQHYEEGKAIFLEESTVKGETILFGRFDIVLVPD